MAIPTKNLNLNQAVYGIKLFLVIGEGENEKRYPIVSAAIEYALNQIPVANVVLPVGKKISSDTEADVNQLNINRRVKAKIVLDGDGVPHPKGLKSQPTPSGNVKNLVIFEGYVGATHYQVNTNSVSNTVVLFHWLHDLDISTVASGDFTKTASHDWFGPESANKSIDTTQGFTYRLSTDSYLQRAQILELDWWEGIFKPGILYKASQPLPRFKNGRSLSREANKYITGVIDRLKSNGRLTLNKDAKEGLLANTNCLSELGKVFTQTVMEAAGGSSAFEKLVSLAREFKFVLAPRTFDCILKEYNPVAPIDKTLIGAEFDFGASTPNPTLIPAAVLVWGRPPESSVLNRINEANTVDSGFVGQYPNPLLPEGIANGPFFIINSPQWLYSTSNFIEFVPTKGISIIPDSSRPSNNNNTSNVQQNVDFRKFGNAYAKTAYYENLFAAKTQEIICGFRDDIELGSSLLLLFQGGAGQITKRGIVNSITHIFSSGETPRVNTIVRLKHVFDENDINYFNVGAGIEHPLFVGKSST
jgi:hypothetical protein